MTAAFCLDGIRVLDLTRLFPGGLCTLALADLGAEVIKIEAPPEGDYARAREPHRDAVDPSVTSISFTALNRGKRSRVLDLKSEAGRTEFLELVSATDVVVESFRPGVMDRLGLGHERLRIANRALVLCSISGWGQVGPFAHRAGHDINYLAETGLLSATGRPDEAPLLPLMQVSDASGALTATIGILAALVRRERTGRGDWVDVSLAHSALTTAAMTVGMALGGAPVARREDGLWSGGVICYRPYRSRDGWVALGALEAKFWNAWCTGVERPDLYRHRYDAAGTWAHAEVEAIFAARSCAEWERFAFEHDCCLSVVRGLDHALGSELVRGRDTVVVSQHESPAGAVPVESLGFPLRLASHPESGTRAPAPVLNEYDAPAGSRGREESA